MAVQLSWVGRDWSANEVCIYLAPLDAPRNGEAYCKAFGDGLAKVGLDAKDLTAGVSDHEGALRKGLRLLGVPLVGCGCHTLQLVVKHVLPPLRPRKQPRPAAASDEGSSSSSDSTDTEGINNMGFFWL